MRITLVYAPAPRQVVEEEWDVPEGTTVAQALAHSAWLQRFPELTTHTPAGRSLGIWGKAAAWDAVLRDRDRVEFYRALRVDPKVARRERFNQQGARGTGLFAQRRAGAKAGY